MRKVILAAILLWPVLSFGADANGYTSEYECRLGGPQCNVDVVGLTTTSCTASNAQIINPGDAWSTIDQAGKTVICLAAGDHSAKGLLTLTASGTAGTRKVLRYYRAGDNDDEPWNQSVANRALIHSIETGNQSYWIFHRLSSTGTNTPKFRTETTTGSNLIYSRLYLANGANPAGSDADILIDAANSTLQNSVIHGGAPYVNVSTIGVLTGSSLNIRIVNNEIYDIPGWLAGTYEIGVPTGGTVWENNDFYVTTATYVDCVTHAYSVTGSCSLTEVAIGMKADSASSNPYRIIHNRFWGMRKCDDALSCDGGGSDGENIGIGGGTNYGDYVLVQNNIVFDSSSGMQINNQVAGGANNISIIGNIFYNINNKGSTASGYGISCYQSVAQLSATEVYLNTIISATGTPGWYESCGENNFDVKCNVVISSGVKFGAPGTGFQIDYNAYYDTTHTSETNKITKTVLTRADSTPYVVGNIIRRSANPTTDCTSAADQDCFLYNVTVAGTSAATPPAYCTTLGCTQTDGTVTLKSVRGPYSFKRKLKTVSGGETVVIPYARVMTDAAENNFCPQQGEADALGSRT